MTKYVLGFAFDMPAESVEDGVPRVALIRKNRPAWQAGKLNGIGGHIEKGEDAYDAMVREFEEETGYLRLAWNRYAKMYGRDFEVYVFRSFGAPLNMLRSTTDEKVGIYSSGNLPDDVLFNLRWLIPLARETRNYHVEVPI